MPPAGRACLILVALSSVLPDARLDAHHSFAAAYDASKPVTLKGTVTRVDWRNPHIWISLDVKGPDGSSASWQCEGTAPNVLARDGWHRDTVKPGDEITVQGFAAKNGTRTCNGQAWTAANGSAVFGSTNPAASDGGTRPDRRP